LASLDEEGPMTRSVRVITQYFPQLHAIPENDRWWGPGFTDWVNVRRGYPLFPGHNQPRVPKGGDYYDQSQERVIRRQVDLAKAHGVYGFAHYHYWFDGKQLLSRPTDLLLANKDIDMPFCLAWANETWSRRWDGQDHRILIEQKHPPTIASWSRHFDRLIQAWTDERYIRVDGKPMFLIYRPMRIHQLGSMMDYWQTRAREHGLPGLHFVAIVQARFPPWETLRLFDAAMLFEPFCGHMALVDDSPQVAAWRQWGGRQIDRLPLFMKDPILNVLKRHERPRIVDYDRVWAQIIARKSDFHLPTYRGAFVDWDNTARYQRRATVFHGATPERFGYWMGKLCDQIARDPREQEFVFLNAWNEWAEGAYLEPDEKHGMAYLEALREAVERRVASAAVA
jgi:lipopolysaccharide biosynthesis protein